MPPTNDDIRANAYVDGELDPYERAALLDEMRQDPVRNREVIELDALKKLVRAAFERPPAAPHLTLAHVRGRTRAGLRQALCAALALVLVTSAFGAGWLARSRHALPDPSLAALHGVRLAAAATRTPGVLLHLESFHGEDANATLQRARKLLEHYRGTGVQVELIVNGMALDFLKAGFFPYSQEFRKLMRLYPNLRVVACGATLEAMREQGQSLPLLKGVKIAPSAVQEVVRRLQEGWAYVES